MYEFGTLCKMYGLNASAKVIHKVFNSLNSLKHLGQFESLLFFCGFLHPHPFILHF